VEDATAGDIAVKATVAEHVGLQLAGVNTEAETPVGRTVVTLKVTAVVAPDRSVAVTVSVPALPPTTIVRLAGEGGVVVRSKLNAGPTVNENCGDAG
jgi:hypothetical protein